jgi:hypothetical protein
MKLQGAFQSGRIPSAKYQQLHARFHHRLTRLTLKTGSGFPASGSPLKPGS